MSTFAEIEALVEDMAEVDGIPLVFSFRDRYRIGLFSLKDDGGDGEDAHESDDLNMVLHMEWFEDTSPLKVADFDDYDTARFWSHP
jgi:hypothetical protein